MRDERAIEATFSSYRPVLGRKVLQLVFEVPMEAQAATFAALGYPQSDTSLWVAIARLLPPEERATTEPANDIKPPAKLSQIAGITCNEIGFWRFIEQRTGHEIVDAEAAAKFVRLACAVKSRADLDHDAKAARAWRDLKTEYDLWLRDAA